MVLSTKQSKWPLSRSCRFPISLWAEALQGPYNEWVPRQPPDSTPASPHCPQSTPASGPARGLGTPRPLPETLFPNFLHGFLPLLPQDLAELSTTSLRFCLAADYKRQHNPTMTELLPLPGLSHGICHLMYGLSFLFLFGHSHWNQSSPRALGFWFANCSILEPRTAPGSNRAPFVQWISTKKVNLKNESRINHPTNQS